MGSLVTAWIRSVYGAVLAGAATNLFDVARTVTDRAPLDATGLQAEIMSSLTSFHTGYEEIGLAIFALHLSGLGYLVYKSADFPKFLGILVTVAGAGYLFDSLGLMLVADFDAMIAQFTFVGEAFLIFWLFWQAAKGFPTEVSSDRAKDRRVPRSPSVIR